MNDLKQACLRFTLAILSGVCFVFIMMNKVPFAASQKNALCASFSTGVFLFVAARLFGERHQLNRWLVDAVAVVAFIAMTYRIIDMPDQTRLLFTLGGILLAMTAPFIEKGARKEQLWNFNFIVWTRFVFCVVVVLLLMAGISLILFALAYLFGFQFGETVGGPEPYFNSGLVLAAVVLPILTMARIPNDFEQMPKPDDDKLIQLVLNYVVSPLLLVLSGIIIAYAAQILIQQNLPRGKVSLLVACLGCSGIVAYILGESRKEADFVLQRLFRKYFFAMLLIPIVLMAIAIGTRIAQHGVTEKRYVIVLVLIWLTLCTLYSFLRPREGFARFALLSAAALVLLASFGPWGMTALSQKLADSQFHHHRTPPHLCSQLPA